MEYKVEGKIFNLFWEYLTFTNFLLDDNHWNIFPLSNEIGLATENARDFKFFCFINLGNSSRYLFGKSCIFGSKIQTVKNYFTVNVGSFLFSNTATEHLWWFEQRSYQEVLNPTYLSFTSLQRNPHPLEKPPKSGKVRSENFFCRVTVPADVYW